MSQRRSRHAGTVDSMAAYPSGVNDAFRRVRGWTQNGRQRIEGKDGTLINGRGVALFSGLRDDISVQMRNGNNAVQIIDLFVPDHGKLNVYQACIQFVAWSSDRLADIPKNVAIHNQLDRASTWISAW